MDTLIKCHSHQGNKRDMQEDDGLIVGIKKLDFVENPVFFIYDNREHSLRGCKLTSADGIKYHLQLKCCDLKLLNKYSLLRFNG